MPVTYTIDAWHRDLAHLNGWKQECRSEIDWNFRGAMRAEALAELELSYQLQLLGMRHYYQVFTNEENMPNLSEEEYKNFQAMQKQSGVVDKVLLVGCAFVVFWFILAILGALVAAKA